MKSFAEVVPIPGETLRYRVASASRPDLPHTVDLSENHGNGACDCGDFLCRREPAIKQGQPLFTRACMCKHIILSRTYFLDTTLQYMAGKLHPKK